MSSNKGFKLTAQATLSFKAFAEPLPEAPKKYKKKCQTTDTSTTALNAHSSSEVQQVDKKLIKGIESSGNQKSNMKLFEEQRNRERTKPSPKIIFIDLRADETLIYYLNCIKSVHEK